MKLTEYMNANHTTVKKVIFCVPKKEPERKREPRPEMSFELKNYNSGSGAVCMNMKLNYNKDQAYFSDRQSFNTFVDGLIEFRKLLDADITLCN